MKNLKQILILCLLWTMGVVASAEEIPNDEIWYTASEKLTATTSTSWQSGLHINAFNTSISSHTFSNGKGVIKFNGNVTSIGTCAFYQCVGLKSITIPNLVTSIEQAAFWNCSGLTSITIPNSVTSIGSSAFYNCSSLTSITIPNSVTSIGNFAFNGCSGLTSVTIPNSVTIIGNEAFYNCSGLTSITIPNSVTSIGFGAFSNCSGLTSITIPNSVTSIGKRAFSGCSGLTSITVSKENSSFSDYGCNVVVNTSTHELICGCCYSTIPNSVKSIGESAFYYCSGLTSITIPNSVTSIGKRAFSGCTGLTSITIPNSVTSIGSGAFESCTGLTSITIPDSVKSIGEYAFYKCSGLTSITIPNSVTSIGDYAFQYCSRLTSITIGNSVISIGDYAFSYISGLKSVTIPNSVTSIGDGAFYSNGSGLRSITIGNSVTSIGDKAFSNCYYVTELIYSYGATRAFNLGLTGLTSVTLPKTITTIDTYAFSGCKYLQTLDIPKSVTSIGAYAFQNMSNLKTMYVHWDEPLTVAANILSGASTSSATLSVPAGTIDKYKSAPVWKNFGTFVEADPIKSTSIQIETLSATIDVGESITLIATVLPENATDQSVTWSSNNKYVATVSSTGVVTAIAAGTATITATTNDGTNLSASCEVTVIEVPKYTRGDANGDSSIDVADISATASHILGSSPVGFVFEAADVNEDKDIDVADISGIANIILNGSGVKAMAEVNGVSVSVADFEINPGETKEVEILLNNPDDEFTGLQLDLYLPEGISIPEEDDEYKIDFGSRTTYKKHSLESALQEDGAIRLLMYSAKNNTFSGENGDVIILTLKANDNLKAGTKTINLKNIVLSRADGSKAEPEDSKCKVTVKGEDPQPSDITVFISDFEMLAGETKEVAINLNNPKDEFTGLQLDLYLPEGISIPKEDDEYKIDFGSRTTYKKHSLESALQEDGAIRLLMYSAKNNTFSGENGDVIILTLKADDNLRACTKTINLKNIVLSRADGSKAEPNDGKVAATISVFDDIEIIESNTNNNTCIYSITGAKLTSPQKGINIIGGKKVLIK